ncbi:uncharacterized protein [Venturia canescens]|nr:uncharacterized protein LOC122409966 isoform X2 [Venturia canescens]XP_043273829.1 uncharacterized protein LOC122409966 isoform X2 [Venturia canescens]
MASNISCLRWLLTASFIFLGISGVVVCATGSYFVDQLHGSLTKSEWYGPPVLLLTTGILNIILGPYFWFFFDSKYNRLQLSMFLTLVVFVAIIEASVGVWALIDHGKVDTAIFKILEHELATVGSIDQRSGLNSSEIKVKCCGFEESSTWTEDQVISWSCCNTRPLSGNQEYESGDICSVFYIDECRDLALHRYRSILIYTSVVAFCATIIQILEAFGLHAYAKKCVNKKRARSFVRSISQQHSRATCTGLQLGPQHVCEGCSPVHCVE